MSANFGEYIGRPQLDASFLTSPGEDLVPKTLLQLSQVPQFVQLFGPYKPQNDCKNQSQEQRWADYQRMDWSVRMLPVINVFESEVEDKDSDQAFLRGSVAIQVFWPPNLRRSDLSRVPSAVKGILENFFSSQYVTAMLDELYYIQRPAKVYGLNEYGKVMTWSPQTEGIVESERVPVTLLNVRYRIDLRAWYRALEFMSRTKENPFQQTLAPLTSFNGDYAGATDDLGQDVIIEVPDAFTVTNP